MVPAVFKTVVGREERPGWVRFPHVSAIPPGSRARWLRVVARSVAGYWVVTANTLDGAPVPIALAAFTR